MPSARRKRAQNKKYYIQNIKELKTKAKSNYSADPEKKKAASKARYSCFILLSCCQLHDADFSGGLLGLEQSDCFVNVWMSFSCQLPPFESTSYI